MKRQYFIDMYIDEGILKNHKEEMMKALDRLIQYEIKQSQTEVPSDEESLCPICGDKLMKQVNSTNLNCVRCGETIKKQTMPSDSWICEQANAITEKLWGTENMLCFGNLEVALQFILIDLFKQFLHKEE